MLIVSAVRVHDGICGSPGARLLSVTLRISLLCVCLRVCVCVCVCVCDVMVMYLFILAELSYAVPDRLLVNLLLPFP